ncbi:MAG: DNA-directed RNA polymerase subunit beta' [Candidatus Dojkabacteria bacterium]
MLKDFNAVKISVASPQDILNWSHGEVTKAETINYRTFRSEPGGLMAEEIFGPTKDFECYCGKYKKVRYKGIVCDRCGVEVTHKRVRRERMGHIKLAAPVAHVWFSNGLPNRLSLILDIPQKKLETVIYYARYVVTGINETEQKTALESIPELKAAEIRDLEEELKKKIEEIKEKFEEQREDAKKENAKEKDKLNMQLERLATSEKTEIARIKAAYNQKQDNIDKKFNELKSLIENLRVASTLSEEEYTMLEDYNMFFFDSGMGAEAIKDLLRTIDIEAEINDLEEEVKKTKSQLKRSKGIQRLRILKGLKKSGVNPEWLILEVLPVIPPDLRPIIQLPGGRFATYDLNDLYRRVINRNNRLKRLINLGAPEIILRNEKRMLQEAVDALLDNNHKPGAPALNSRQMPFKSLSDMLRGKQGRFRQNLLGKRVDYSARAVIVAGPELNFNECGLPKNIALELFKPFILRELIERGYAANPNRAKMIFEAKDPEVWDILEEVSAKRPVLLNRAPSLHKYSILAFYPRLIEGNAIRIHPMVCKGFNADFDGDQMAVHLPLSDLAVQEAEGRMFAKDNMLHIRDRSPIVNVSKDMTSGIYFLTLMRGTEKDAKKAFSSHSDLLTAFDLGFIKLYEPVKLLHNGKVIVTTAGRALFNSILPDKYEFINKEMTAKDISALTSEIYRNLGNEQAIKTLDETKRLGFEFSTRLGWSVGIEDFRFGADAQNEKKLQEFDEYEKQLLNDYYEGMITANELKRLKVEKWIEITDNIQDQTWELAQKKQSSKTLVELDKSGAVPVKAWIKQISGVRGMVYNMDGQVVSLPLRGNFEKGLNSFEYFVAAKAARKSMADVALKTAESGYLTRRLVDVAQDLITFIEDCGSTESYFIFREEGGTRSFADRIEGRVLNSDLIDPKTNKTILTRNEMISHDLAKEIEANENITKVDVRSPLTCVLPHGLSQLSYGVDNSTGKLVNIGEAVGVIAAQALGEPTTQLTLKSKSDARSSKADVTQGLPRVEELLEARTPKALAILAEIDGTVNIIEEKKKLVIRISAKKHTTKKLNIDKSDEVIVKDGQEVNKNDVIVIKADKTEIRAPFGGIVNVANNEIKISADRQVEIDKYVDLNTHLLVKDGDKVTKGQQLTEGSIDPKELATLKGVLEAQRYIINEVQKVYAIQGLEVDDRHLEIVVRQMGRFGLISDSGDSENFLPGDYADFREIELENKHLVKEGKAPIKYERVLIGITNAALRTESFLSAASFQQQVRVLTDAALIGKVDYLRGLKENVIIGRPVPLGSALIEHHPEKIKMAQQEARAIAA